MEFIDRPCLEAANSYIKDHTIPVVEALLLIETDGQDSRRVQEEATILAEICRQMARHPFSTPAEPRRRRCGMFGEISAGDVCGTAQDQRGHLCAHSAVSPDSGAGIRNRKEV